MSSLEQAVQHFQEQYDLAMQRYGYVEYGPDVKFEAVTKALCDANKDIIFTAVEEGAVKAPTQEQLVRCLYDMMYFNVHSCLPKDAPKYSKKLFKALSQTQPTFH